MTPEEHIQEAEELLETTKGPGDLEIHALRLNKAAVHVSIAFFKKQHPPESGRPIPKTGYQPESGLPVPTPGASYAEPCE